MAKSARELYFDHPALEVLATNPTLDYREANRERAASYNVRYQTPFGEVGGRVDPLIFQDAEKLKEDDVVLLQVRPRSEFPKGQFIKGGFYFQFDIIGVTAVPADFGDRLRSRATGAAKDVASKF